MKYDQSSLWFRFKRINVIYILQKWKPTHMMQTLPRPNNKKKISSKIKRHPEVRLSERPNSFLSKFAQSLRFHKPESIKLKQITNVTKSSNITPSVKSRRSNKDKLMHSVSVKRFSERSTFLEHNFNLSKSKKRNDYQFLFQIGSGGFGRVWKVIDKKTSKAYAMKQMSKAKVLSKKSVNSIMNEKKILAELSHPFIINSLTSFQDREKLYLAMEYLRGGDLRYHMCFNQYFTEEQTKFIVCCIVEALEYIHSKNIIHRDLKPQNIVFEESGYVRVTDFGVARKRREENADETSGTPGYMSPQVICRMNHSYQCDFFALGVITYELMFGERPYVGQSRKQIREKMLSHQIKITEVDLPPNWSPACLDFVNRLLKRNKQSRLGYRSIVDIKGHPWLKSINWSKLSKKQLIPPFAPGALCQSPEYQFEMQSSQPSEVNEQVVVLLRSPQIQKLFRNYQKRIEHRKYKSSQFNFIYR